MIAGGEYDRGAEVDLCAAEIYDPMRDHWTTESTPKGWDKIGDAACCVLPNGSLLMGSIAGPDCAIFNPATSTWTATGSKLHGQSDEESWVLLADGSVLTADCFGSPKTERYINGHWRDEGVLPESLVDASPEIGPALLLPDGRAFFIGATGKTALFQPDPNQANHGTWKMGPRLPSDDTGVALVAKDAPACLLPDGKVLCAVGPYGSDSGTYGKPTTLLEFDPLANVWTNAASVGSKGVAPDNLAEAPYTRLMLMLPTGEVLFASQSPALWLYQPGGTPLDEWRPRIITVANVLVSGQSYELRGTSLNGISQCCAYGDDVAYATNYPLVRLRASNGEVRYCRTFGHSTMAIATGATPVTTNFTVPGNLLGRLRLSVIANGIESSAVIVDVAPANQAAASIGP